MKSFPKGILLTCVAFLIACVSAAQANKVRITWTVPDFPEVSEQRAQLKGYRLYQREASGLYTEIQDIDRHETSIDLDNLEEGRPYHFALTALYESGESELSNEGRMTILPFDEDRDRDGLADWEEEEVYSTDPNLRDTDGDGLSDGQVVDFWGESDTGDVGEDGLITPNHVDGSLEETAATRAAARFPGRSWQKKRPSQLGLDGEKLDRLARAVRGRGIVIKDGYQVKSWGSQSQKSEWGSATKPVFSTLLLFAVKERKLSSVDDLIEDWGWNLSSKDPGMTFRHLANMTSGYTRAEAPGRAWAYNDYGINLYSKTLLHRVLRAGSSASAVDRMARKSNRLGRLQFQDGRLFRAKKGSFRLHTSVRDFARIGWFWLHQGKWKGRQLLPRSFFGRYVKPGVSRSLRRTRGEDRRGDYLRICTHGGGSDQTPLGPGVYGLNWWFNANRRLWQDVPADAFQANGHWNREALTVIPSLGIVAAWIGKGSNPRSFNRPMNDYLKLLVDSVRRRGLSPPRHLNVLNVTP
ncbi:MAG: hypothetical protein ETSY2_39105 [Candidatus Entotheonella gemina]|uniref:Fibronectin type-III domain-containing protein n=3 Tax=Candidatus Entotheonella TaxID=93171 RepID=W4LRS0_9BACT|nr:MAG: hypothetical protein ETSY2_39105 [Candidatus Entotheonella gemina]